MHMLIRRLILPKLCSQRAIIIIFNNVFVDMPWPFVTAFLIQLLLTYIDVDHDEFEISTVYLFDSIHSAASSQI